MRSLSEEWVVSDWKASALDERHDGETGGDDEEHAETRQHSR